jgi:proteasome lid subunit RPN8/RPN11
MAGGRGYEPLFPAIAAIAEADPEREVCGLVIADAGGALSVVPARNVSPEPGERYELDPAFHLAMARRLRAVGGSVAAVFHSHVDGPAALSAEDRRLAVEEGVPVMPGVDLLVAGMRAGKVEEVKVFTWHGGDYVAATGVARRVAGGSPGAKPALR